MSRFSRIITVSAATLAIGASAAGAANTAVGPQQSFHGKASPVSFPGGKLHKGQRVPEGAKIVYRQVDLKDGQRATLTLTVPKGSGLSGFGVSGHVRVEVPAKTSTWVGHRRITVTVYARGDAATGAFYALGR